jgi:hypothetical protein
MPQGRPTQQISISLKSHRRIIWSITSSQLSTQRRTVNPSHGLLHPSQGYTSFHLKRHTHLMGIFPTQGHTVPSPSQRERHTHLMGIFPTQGHTTFHLISERNDTPISWAHPTHGLSHRSTHSVCVLEDVSRSCNHQHSLSAREAFSTRPSLSRKYSNFVLASGLVKISAICSCVGRYCTCTAFLCTMSLI